MLLPDKSLFEIPIFNASAGGLGIIFPYVLKIAYPVNIEFYVPLNGEKKRLRAKTKVAYNALRNDGSVQLGLKFTMMSDEDKKVFLNVIKDKMTTD